MFLISFGLCVGLLSGKLYMGSCKLVCNFRQLIKLMSGVKFKGRYADVMQIENNAT